MADRLARAEARRFSEARAAHYVRSMLSSVAACHRRDVCHRDIKLANFVVAAPADDAEGEGRTKLIDFGFSRIYRGAGSEVNAAMRGACGTSDCMPPEMLIGEYYGPEVDVWSVGIAAYRLLSGDFPFGAPKEPTQRVYQRIIRGVYSVGGPVWDSISSNAKDLVVLLLDSAPTTRISAEAALRHPWLNA